MNVPDQCPLLSIPYTFGVIWSLRTVLLRTRFFDSEIPVTYLSSLETLSYDTVFRIEVN